MAFYATKDGKITISYPGWDDKKVVLPGQVFEIRWGKQGVESRVIYGEPSTPCRSDDTDD